MPDSLFSAPSHHVRPKDGGITDSIRHSILSDLHKSHPGWADVAMLYINGLDVQAAVQERLRETRAAIDEVMRELVAAAEPIDNNFCRSCRAGYNDEPYDLANAIRKASHQIRAIADGTAE